MRTVPTLSLVAASLLEGAPAYAGAVTTQGWGFNKPKMGNPSSNGVNTIRPKPEDPALTGNTPH